MRNILLLGGTGSVGSSSLQVIQENRNEFSLYGISFDRNVDKAFQIIKEFSPNYAHTNNEEAAKKLNEKCKNFDTQIIFGKNELQNLIINDDIDIIISAISGFAGLETTISAAKTGKTILLANKESIVVAGDILMPLANSFNTLIIPVDSEHNAIHQCLASCNDHKDISKVIITASGGPFLGKSINDLDAVTLDQALNHPNWSMGSKISIDSATLVNKCLELIEARYLFNLHESFFDLVIHPQSIIHSVVTYTDGSSIAHMSNPNMSVPIANALSNNRKIPIQFNPMDFGDLNLSFKAFPEDRLFLERMARDVCNEGGLTGTIFNAANEVAVSSFLNGNIKFSDIYSVLKRTFDIKEMSKKVELESIYEMDKETRKRAKKVIESLT
jgi:1-deoxy-D-xylulose-5-phosphate reductoisomerase